MDVSLRDYGLLAILVVMLLKEVGVPVPVPSDLIMITAGIQAASGAYSLPELVIALEAAIVGGGSLQFLLVRGAGRRLVYRFGRFIGLTPQRLDQAGLMLRKRGPLAIFLGLNVPGARAGIVPAAALAGTAYPVFAPAMVAGTTVFFGWHVALGYLVGPTALSILEGLHLPIGPVLLGLAALGLLAWLVLRGRRVADPQQTALDRLHSWTEAACPACLAATALQRLSAQPGPASAS